MWHLEESGGPFLELINEWNSSRGRGSAPPCSDFGTVFAISGPTNRQLCFCLSLELQIAARLLSPKVAAVGHRAPSGLIKTTAIDAHYSHKLAKLARSSSSSDAVSWSRGRGGAAAAAFKRSVLSCPSVNPFGSRGEIFRSVRAEMAFFRPRHLTHNAAGMSVCPPPPSSSPTFQGLVVTQIVHWLDIVATIWVN